MFETITQSLEIAAEQVGDINRAVYDAYFARCPDAEDVLGHADELMLGRMMEQVLLLLMADAEEGYIEFERSNHQGYGVKPQMYDDFLQALREVVQHSTGDSWNADMESAWSRRIDQLTHAFNA